MLVPRFAHQAEDAVEVNTISDKHDLMYIIVKAFSAEGSVIYKTVHVSNRNGRACQSTGVTRKCKQFLSRLV